jgi:hypothetical protein
MWVEPENTRASAVDANIAEFDELIYNCLLVSRNTSVESDSSGHL